MQHPPKSYNREGGPDRVKLARYARYFGVFLIALSVLAWVTLSKRPGVRDETLAEAVAWAESARRVPCERPVLFGEPLAGTGSLRALVDSGHCGDERCSPLVEAVQHERVCAPERNRSGDWLESVIDRQRGLTDPAEKLRLLMHAMRALDDFRRGEQRAFPQPNDGAELHMAVQAIWLDSPPQDAIELARAAETLVATSPDATFLVGRNAGEVLWILRRGQVQPGRRVPHPRASSVALARLGQGLEQCSDFACVTTYFGSLPRAEPVPKWRLVLQGPRAAGQSWIVGNTRFIGQQLAVHVTTFEKQRAVERVLAAALRIRTELGCASNVEEAARALGETMITEDANATVRMQAGEVSFEITLESDGTDLWIRDALPDALALRDRLCSR